MRVAAFGLLLVLVGIAGCGDDDEPESAPAATSELAIALDPDGQGGEQPQEALITCPGTNAPPSVCAAVAELPPNAADPVPPSTPCTEIYGGPDVVTIEGTIEGEPIDAELTRTNGCEIERFERFTPLLEALFPDYRPGESLAP